MARNRKSGRYSRKTTTRARRRKPATNLTALAQSYALAEVTSRNIAGVSLWDFFTQGTTIGGGSGSGWQQSGDPHNSMITLKEIFKGEQIGSGISVGNALKSNIRANGIMLVGSLILIPVAFSVGTKLLKKPRASVNKLLRSANLKEVRV